MLKLLGSSILTASSEAASIADLTTQIGTFLTSALGWMTSIFKWMIGEPVILFFLAIGLAGVMFRWARSVMHF